MPRVYVFLCVFFCLSIGSLSSLARYAPANVKWNQPVPPFRIADNLYYVGAEGVASYLITTPAGDILLDTGFTETVPLVEASIRKLGFRVSDVRILLISHGHFDHAGGEAAMKAATHARLLVSPAEAPMLESGDKDDFAWGGKYSYQPVSPDGLLTDGQPVHLGGVALTPHFTPGHTKGCTTWTMTVRDHGELRHVVFACSLSTPDYQVVNNPRYQNIQKDLAASFATMRVLPCDIFLAAHPWEFDLDGKRAALTKNPAGAANPFVDPAGYRAYIDRAEAALRERVAQQTKVAGGHS
jgi:metallo-beta-lactamase class B